MLLSSNDEHVIFLLLFAVGPPTFRHYHEYGDKRLFSVYVQFIYIKLKLKEAAPAYHFLKELFLFIFKLIFQKK